MRQSCYNSGMNFNVVEDGGMPFLKSAAVEAPQGIQIGDRVRTAFKIVTAANAEVWEVVGYHENGFPLLRGGDGTEWACSAEMLKRVE